MHTMTIHAGVRSQQRGISSDVIQFILDNGQEYWANKGAKYVLYGNRVGRCPRNIRNNPEALKLSEKAKNKVVVVEKGCVITVFPFHNGIRLRR